VNTLLRKQVRGVEVTDVVFAEGQFRITTSHTFDRSLCNNEGSVPRDDSSSDCCNGT
jgi:hypothetical protein